ncbi:MAG: HupE/UreJ family protein [Sandaracinobacteroides sp.]
MTLLKSLLIVLAACLLGAGPAQADVFRPAYLEVEQHPDAPTRYDVLWKVPALDEQRVLAVTPLFPDGTRELTRPVRRYAQGATVMRWQVAVPGGLEGKAIGFAWRSQSAFDVLLRYRAADGTEQVRRASLDEAEVTIAPRPGNWEVARNYTWIGIEHILGGADHLLFVLALVLIVSGWKRLIGTVTAFTVAHSITLMLATLEVVSVPGPPVEAAIALSIMFVAIEVLRLQQGKAGLAARYPWLVAFGFGLLHGLGFAGALAEIGLPQGAVPLALLFFNVGVELGQLAFVGLILGGSAIAAKIPALRRREVRLRTATSYAIGSIASFWVLQRVAAF